MNAQELTKVVTRLENELIEVKKDLEFLKQENEKLRLKVSDLEIDVRQK